MGDPYALLGVPPGTAIEEIRTAFRRAALRTHPDKQGGSHEAFYAVQWAFDTLLNAANTADPNGGHESNTVASPGDIRGTAADPNGDPWHIHFAEAQQMSQEETVPTNNATFDPWSMPTFDPWSSAAFDPWSAGDTGWGGTNGAATFAEDSAGQIAPQEDVSHIEGKKRKRKHRDKSPLWKTDKSGVKKVAFDRNLMRNGVYGFRPSSSSSEDEGFVQNKSRQLHKPIAKPCAQFRCAVHQRLRFRNALVEDGDGKLVCAPGMECP